jgi:hypothetical protein
MSSTPRADRRARYRFLLVATVKFATGDLRRISTHGNDYAAIALRVNSPGLS